VEEVNVYLTQDPRQAVPPRPGAALRFQLGGRDDPRAETLAAVIELVHLATLVHDDAVDHSVLRRGMPTVNALWSHQVAIIMGDYLYSRSIIELTRLGDLEADPGDRRGGQRHDGGRDAPALVVPRRCWPFPKTTTTG
jgi:hypothetical protein